MRRQTTSIFLATGVCASKTPVDPNFKPQICFRACSASSAARTERTNRWNSRKKLIGSHNHLLIRKAPKNHTAENTYTDRFNEAFDEIKKMGICPKKTTFVRALGVLAVLPKKKWEEKVENLRGLGLGWSQDHVSEDFTKQPHIARVSTEKARKVVKSVEEKLALTPDHTMKNRAVLSMSLEKRLMPSHGGFTYSDSEEYHYGDINVFQYLCVAIHRQPQATDTLDHRRAAAASRPHFLGFVKPYSISSFGVDDSSSLTASLLMRSCGISDHEALSISKKVQFNVLDKALPVPSLLKDYGFD
ncbi:hypothetical protein ZIOFF_013080 [Zingiber officinale]|uniref:Uncharacterized protein n=1 Tax=Zingiber officinale TaxID=94328 RepID=A0A8J5HFG3_ZINOF|nr:hypothetical protein ZIOFF_013080 [Zingiber officinale]